ncbi:hypothetical protein R3W88_007993 [Solanum pinnatisectum]|uniref:Uncharacterized protein n=1 Tax=Solanum pinnatisectum TaxID=50273 RepID=A0AAV9M792_9SOLN|nr:hypothetical protein R3W88_007993 [Solanum pinnatisectum]
MEKSKSINIELTEEDLRIKLQRLTQEIQETRERRIAVEIATAVARAYATLDEELAAKMARHAIVNENIATMRNGDDVFKDSIAMMLQRLRKEYPLLDNTVCVPENNESEAVEEELEEEIVYRPPLLGRWKEGNEKIALEAYEFTPR